MKQMHLYTSLRDQVAPDGNVLPDELIVLLPPGWPPDIPLVRISTCGNLTVEGLRGVKHSSDGRVSFVYEPHKVPPNGGATALNLLKLLVSQPGRFATKDWLIEKLRPNRGEDEEWGGLVRLDNIVTLLRKMLCPLELQDKKQVGRLLLEYVKPTLESGSGYRLAPYPLIWLDVEAISAHIQCACQLQAEGQDARQAWQRAYQLAKSGPFLAEGWYSDWAVARREEVEGSLWQSVQALWRIALVKQGEAGEEEALRLLREYWLRHVENEDAFRPLIELLGKRGDYQRVEEYYQHLCEKLQQEGRIPSQRTQQIIQSLRVGQSACVEAKPTLNVKSGLPGMDTTFLYAIPQDIIEAVDMSEEVAQQSGTQDMEPSRRDFLQTCSILGATLFISPHIQDNEKYSQAVSRASVTNLAAITQQFRAMQRQGDTFITNGVKAHIQTIQEALEQTMNDTIRRELWRLLAQAQTVAGFNPIKKTERGRAKTFLEAAVASAQNSGDALLIGASLGHLAHFSLREEQNLMKATQLLRQAQEYIPGVHSLNGWFSLVMASIAAKGGYQQQCEGYLTEAMTRVSHLPQTPDTADLYFTDFSLTSVKIFTVNCWLTLGNATKAYEHFIEMNLEDLADNRRASAYCDASRACAMMGEFEMAQQFAVRAIDKASLTQQRYVIPRCITVARTIKQRAPEKPYAAAIADYAHLVLQKN